MTFRYKEGDPVRVLEKVTLGHHIRTPQFLRGKNGIVRSIRGNFKDPELLSFGKDGLPKATLYSVEFDLTHVWDDRPPPKGVNKIYADIFEQWLEAR
jgi:nitrile hydratase subunit beta